jgi:Tfp pilus assembly protein PilF
MTQLLRSRLDSSLAAFVLLLTAVLLAYAPGLRADFTFDDRGVIVGNPLIKDIRYWPTLLTSDYWAGTRDPAAAHTIHAGLYRPLVLLSFAINYAAAGPSPWSYHLVNVLLQGMVSWLLYLLARQLALSTRASLVCALIFALHPIHTEAVIGIVGRAELFMAVGVLAGLVWYIQGRVAFSLAAFVFALLSKEQAVVLPVLLWLYNYACRAPLHKPDGQPTGLHQAIARYGLYGLILIGYGVVRWSVVGLQSPPTPFLDNPLPHLDWWPRALTTVKVAGSYLALCLWPGALSADYSYQAISVSSSIVDPGVLFGALAWGTVIIGGIVALHRMPAAGFAAVFLIVTFLPVSNLLIPIGTIMGERLFYLPSAGFCLLAGLAYETVRRATDDVRARGLAPVMGIVPYGSRFTLHALRLLMVLICLALLVRTIVRTQDWLDDEHLAHSMLRVVPDSAKVHSILGRLAKDGRRWTEAIEHFQMAVRLYPQYPAIDPTLNSNFGIALIEAGYMAEGIESLERASALDPEWSLPLYNLGFAYSRQGRYAEAERVYREAARRNEADPKAYTGLGFLYLQEGRYDQALEAAETALRREPDSIEALYVKAQALRALGQAGPAADILERIIALDPSKAPIREEFGRPEEEKPSSSVPPGKSGSCPAGFIKC